MGASALEAALRKYDADSSGRLDSFEFEAACSDLGFGSVAKTIYAQLSSRLGQDGRGLPYKELVTSLLSSGLPANTETKSMLSALALSGGTEDRASEGRPTETSRPMLDTTGWNLTGRDAISVQKELQALLSASNGFVA